APDKAPLESTKPLEVDWSKQVEEAPSKDFPINTERKQEKPAPVTNTYHDEAIDEPYEVPAMYPIGQLQGTYILAQNENGFYMIDQHAAQERIKYEFFKKKLGQTMDESQQLLMPLTFEFTANEILFIEKHRKEMEAVGLYLEPFGGQTYAVKAHP